MRAIALTTASMLTIGFALTNAAIAQQPSTASMAETTSAASKSNIEDKLKQAGIEDRKEFKGRLVTAQAPSGHPVQFLFGPKDFEADTSPEEFDQDRIRANLAKGGYRNIQFASDANMVRGQISGDKQVLAFSSGAAVMPAPAQSKSPGTSDLKSDLEKLGLDDSNEFRGQLVTAQTGQGQIRILIGPEDFKGGTSATLSANDLSKLQNSGFPGAQVSKDVTMIKGRMDDKDVIAIAGQGLSTTTGSAR